MVSLLLALSKCVLIPQMRCTWHKHASPPPLLPSVATNAARAAITSARCCLYHSFSSEPPLPLFTSSECPPSLLIPRATFYPPIPKPFHDDPNTPSPPHIPLLGTCVPPGQQASSHNTWPANSSRSHRPPPPLTTRICKTFFTHMLTCTVAHEHNSHTTWFATRRRRANNAFRGA